MRRRRFSIFRGACAQKILNSFSEKSFAFWGAASDGFAAGPTPRAETQSTERWATAARGAEVSVWQPGLGAGRTTRGALGVPFP